MPETTRDRQREMVVRYRDLDALRELLGDEKYYDQAFMARLRDALGVTGLAAELVKKDRTTKAIHEQLNALGIPERTTQGVGICVEGRLAVAFSRLDR